MPKIEGWSAHEDSEGFKSWTHDSKNQELVVQESGPAWRVKVLNFGDEMWSSIDEEEFIGYYSTKKVAIDRARDFMRGNPDGVSF